MKRRAYAALSNATFLNSLGSNIHAGIWPFYLQQNRVGDELYGAFSTTSSLVGILARMLSSKLGVVGESFPLIAGILASVGMMLIYAFLPSQLGIGLGLAISSVSMALVFIGRTTLVGREGRSKGLATSYAVLTTLANVGLIIGTNLGTVIFKLGNYATVFLVGALTCAVAVAVAFIWLPRDAMPSTSGFGVVRLRQAPAQLKRFYWATCLDSFSWSICMPFYTITPARIFSVTDADIALIQTLMFGAATATNLVFGALSDRLWGRKSLLAISEWLGLIVLGLYVLAPNIQPIFVSALLMGLVISSWGPIVSAYVSEASTAEQLHDNVGTWLTLTALVRVPAPIIGGFLAERWFERAPYLVSLVLVLVTAAYIQKYLKEPKRGL